MTGKYRTAFACNLAAIAIIAAIALVYLFTPSLLPYQEVAIGTNWTELSTGLQTQFLSLLTVSGGGYLATAAGLFIMLWIPFKRREAWARWAIPAIGIPAILTVNYAGLIIIQNTPARPPLIAGPIVIVLLIVGFLLSGGSAKSSATKTSY